MVHDTRSPLLRRPGTVADGWTVARSDVGTGDVRLITFERPRVVGAWRSAGDIFNNGADWLAWVTGTGAYARR